MLFVFHPKCEERGESFNGVIMLSRDALGYTIAHETMHELFDMQDIFPVSEKKTPPQIFLQGPVARSRMQRDWGSLNPSMNYYGVKMQPQWIRRLLMYHNDRYSGVGIPRGNIYGIYYELENGNKVWSEGMTSVGLFNFLTVQSGGGEE